MYNTRMSLKFCALASGSKGNCCFISDGATDILIDLGISATHAEKCLRVLGVDPDKVAVVVTHSHSDHIGGLKIFCKKHPSVRVYCQSESYRAVATAEGITPVRAERRFTVGSLDITALPVSHDVPCFGYIVAGGTNRVAVATDIGRVTGEQLSALSSCDIVMLEANHDPDMLNANPRYTPMLKARIRSDHGHLSNGDCAAACAFLAANGVKNFVLAHLSEENNTPDAALTAVKRSVADSGAQDVRIIAAGQHAMTGLFEIC